MPVTAVLIGAGGFGREVLDVVEAHNANLSLNDQEKIMILGVADDSPSPENEARLSHRGYTLLGDIECLVSQSTPSNYILGIGKPIVRQLVAERLESAGWTPLTVIHPSAVVGSIDSIGHGTIICGGVQLSTNTRLGKHCHLNPNSTVGHDTVLGEYVSVNPAAVISGDVTIGKLSLVGAGAIILQQLEIGEGSLIGAGACVTKPLVSDSIVVGIPARPI